MKSATRSKFTIAERLFDLPVERWISWARVALASVAFGAAALNRGQLAGHAEIAQFVLLAYLCFGCVLVLVASKDRFRPATQCVIHGVDIGVSSSLMLLTDGQTSPFFPFFMFILVAATLRWAWRGTLATATILAVIITALYLVGFGPELTALNSLDAAAQIMTRAGFLIVCGALLAYVGAIQERSRTRFAKLATWPIIQPTVSSGAPADATLVHAAEVMRAPRVLLIWEQADEPYRHVSILADRKVYRSRERSDLFGLLVGPMYNGSAFIFEAGQKPTHTRLNDRNSSMIDADLERTFDITSVVTAPFLTENCTGRVFVLDRETWTDEDVPLTRIVASRFAVELEESLLRQRLEASVASRERERVARDLHDGILQGLAAASIQLKLSGDQMAPEAQEQMKHIRALLSHESKRIRNFVEETRMPEGSFSGVVRLEHEIAQRIQSLREQWGCEIDLSVTDSAIETSVSAARNVRHLVTEAVSNAVRHGGASRVQVNLDRAGHRLAVRIQDNGNGFDHLAGSYSKAELAGLKLGPLSLRSRVDDLGGALYLTSSGEGTDIRIELPA
jgi:signal transduction histidine kinase